MTDSQAPRRIEGTHRFAHRSSRRWPSVGVLFVGLVMFGLVEAPWARAIFVLQTLLVGWVVVREFRGGRVLVVDDAGYRLEVAGAVRFAVRWDEVVKVQSIPETGLLHVDTGTPDRNLLLPPSMGWGFQYAGQTELCGLITGRVPDRVTLVRMPTNHELEQQKKDRALSQTDRAG